MNTIFSIIGILLLLESAAFLNDNLTLIIKLEAKLLIKLKLLSGCLGVFAVIIMFFILIISTNQFGYDDNYVVLSLFDVKFNRGWVFLFLLLSFLENVYFIYLGIKYYYLNSNSSRQGSRVTASTGRTAAASRAAELLHLGPHQTKALVYIYENNSMTVEDFQCLCPDADRPTLEQDLQGMVRLGIMVPKGDKFIIT